MGRASGGRVGVGAFAGCLAAILIVPSALGRVDGRARSAVDQAPENTAPPTVTDRPFVGAGLTATTGTWSGTAPITYAYQWRRCDTAGAACVDIGGATQAEYQVAMADRGSTLRARVTATNTAGSSWVESAATGVVDTVERFVFSGTGDNPYPELYASNSDGTNVVRLTNGGIGAGKHRAAVASDGSKITFDAQVNGSYTQIFVMNADGSNQQRVTNSPSWDSTPTFSPDGQQIAFSSDRTGGGDIYRMNVDGTGLVRLTTDSNWEGDPAYSPDGSKIAFARYTGAPAYYDIYLVDANVGGVPQRLTSAGTNEYQPEFSPDGTQIVFVSNTGSGGTEELEVMRASDGANRERLTNNSSHDSAPTFLGNGRIAFSTGRDGPQRIYTMRADGTDVRRVTDGPGGDTSPAGFGPALPENAVAPTVSGQAEHLKTLTATKGRWRSAAPPTYTYQWLRCDAAGANCAPVPTGGTEASYVVAEGDVASTLRVRVTAMGTGGSSSADSQQTTVVAPTKPVSTAPPTVAGTVLEGESITGGPGGWDGTSPISRSWQWQRCDPNSYKAEVLGDGALGYWRLDDTDWYVRDSAGYNTGTTGSWWRQEPTAIVEDGNKSTRFDYFNGIPYYAQLGEVQVDQGDFTIEAWIYHVANALQSYWSHGYVGLYAHDFGQVSFWVSDGTQGIEALGGYVYDGAWHHMVGVRQGNVFRLYQDGVLAATRTGSLGDVDPPGSTGRIGNNNGGYAGMRGLMDEVAIYRKALTADEIKWRSDRGRNCYMEDVTGVPNASGTFAPSDSTTPPFQLSAADVGKRLRLKVTAANGTGSTDAFSAGTAFVPAAPRPDTPLTGTTIKTYEPVLRAEWPGHASPSFRFQIANDSGFASPVVTSPWLYNTNTWTVTAGRLQDDRTYYWRVQGSDAKGESAWSSGRRFDVRVTPLGVRGYWPMWQSGPLAVNEVTGNLVLSLPGPSYPTATGEIGASLTFNSKDTKNRGIGVGWTVGAGDAALGDPPTGLWELSRWGEMDAVFVEWADGSGSYYTHVANSNVYQAPPGDSSKLRGSANHGFTLTEMDGSIYSFAAGNEYGFSPMVRAEFLGADPTSAVTYTFTGDKVTKIRDGAGREVVLNWTGLNGCGVLLCVTGPDGVVWQYIGEGGSTGRLVRVNNGTRDLARLTWDTNGRLVKFENANDLNPGSASPGYDGTHAVTIAYDGSGRVSTVSEGPVSGQTPAVSTWTFEYYPGAVNTTATRAAHGATPAGTVRSAAGYSLVTPPREQGQGTPKKTKVFYDLRDHPMESQDLLGNVTMASYNEKDQLVWTEDEYGLPTDTTWDAVDDVPLTTTSPDPDGPGPLGRPVTETRYDEKKIGTSSAAGAPLEGLAAEYFENTTMAGRPKRLTTDATVDFAWSVGLPPDIGTGTYSARWNGDLIVERAGHYVFKTTKGQFDGTRLTIGEQVVIDNWDYINNQEYEKSSPAINLAVGKHTIVLEYGHFNQSGQMKLSWSCAGCSPAVPQQIIPSSALRPAWLNATSAVDPASRVAFMHYSDPGKRKADYTLAKLADGTNVITSFSYDSYGRVTQKVMPKGNDGRTIDANGNLGGTPDFTFATDWVYYGLSETAAPPAACGGGTAVSQAGLLKSVTPRGVATTTSVYDNAGRAVAVTNGKGSTCRTFDPEGRLVSERAPDDAQATVYAYDPAGQRRTATDASGVVTIEYDEAGRVKRSLDSYGAEARFTYDQEGNLVQRVSSPTALGSGSDYTSLFVYDAQGRLTQVTDPAARVYAFAYDARGALRTTQYPNGTFSWNEYNQAGWLTAVFNRHGTLATPLPAQVPADANAISDFAYGYGIDGKKTSETRSGGGLPTESWSYVYDTLGRLEQVTLPNTTVRRYLFDLDSNRTSITEGGSTTESYAYDPAVTEGVDQLTSVSRGGQTTSFTYSGDGEVATRGADTIGWDGWGRMSGGTFAGTTLTYGFDPLGRRRSRSAAGETTRYLFAGAGEPHLYETNGAGVVEQTDVDGALSDVAHYLGPPTLSSDVRFVYFNGHGDTAAETDATGARTAAWSYDPFGQPREAQPANTTVERYTGRWDKQHDTLSELIQMGVRPYDPTLGRFYAVDPIEGGSANAYDYAGQDPINLYDLTGKVATVDEMGAVGRAPACFALACHRDGKNPTPAPKKKALLALGGFGLIVVGPAAAVVTAAGVQIVAASTTAAIVQATTTITAQRVVAGGAVAMVRASPTLAKALRVQKDFVGCGIGLGTVARTRGRTQDWAVAATLGACLHAAAWGTRMP